MTYKIYKMTFKAAHFGKGELFTSEDTFTADRLFSALVLEAISHNCLDDFMTIASQDDFLLTDAFPYIDVPYLPKPIGYPERDSDNYDGDVIALRKEAKRQKKLQFIAYHDLDAYMKGAIFDNPEMTTHSSITKNQPDLDGGLYQVGVSYFKEGVSLYVVATESTLLNQLMLGLQYSGLGGKRSSGYGSFELDILPLPKEFAERFSGGQNDVLLLLTSSLPVDEELEKTLTHAKYLLYKSSGFAFTRSSDSNLRKQDFYKFKSGTTTKGCFKGSIRNLAPKGIPHPVWHFAKPSFYRLEIAGDEH